MEKTLFTAQEVVDILSTGKNKTRAQIWDQGTDQPINFQILTLTLGFGVAQTAEDPIKINFPFQTIYVLKSTHPALVVKFRPNVDSTFQGALELTEKDVFDFGKPLAKGFLHWDAQSVAVDSSVKQQVTLLIAVDGSFRPGSLSNVKGGINTDQYAGSIQSNLTLVGTTALNISDPVALTQIASFVKGQTPRQVLIQNYTAAILYVGPTALVTDTGATRGFAIADGDSFKWNNKTSLYGYSVAGGTINVTYEF